MPVGGALKAKNEVPTCRQRPLQAWLSSEARLFPIAVFCRRCPSVRVKRNGICQLGVAGVGVISSVMNWRGLIQKEQVGGGGGGGRGEYCPFLCVPSA